MAKIRRTSIRRILIVTLICPYDLGLAVHGIYQRFRMLLEAAAATCAHMDILFFVPEGVQGPSDAKSVARALKQHWGITANVLFGTIAPRKINAWNFYISPLWSIRNHPNFAAAGNMSHGRRLNEAIAPDTDLIVAHRLQAALSVWATGQSHPPVVLDLDDIEHVRFRRELAAPPFWLGKIIRYLQIPAILASEIRAVRLSAKTFVCSQKDQKYLRRVCRAPQVQVIPNSVALPVAVPECKRDYMLFVGSYGYAPNVDAAEFLLREVFPRVYAALPATRLLLVGNSIVSLPSHASGVPGVEFTGFVENLSEIYAQAAVVCCPIRYGGGTRIKIIEAAAHGAAIVSTSIGAEGLDFIPGAEILIRDKSDEFADACIKLLLDPRAAREMGIKARSKARRYDRARVLEEIAHVYESSAYVE